MSKLLEEILSDDNIAKAIKVVKSRKGASGIDHMSIYELDDYFKDNIVNQKFTKIADLNFTNFADVYSSICERMSFVL